jgi:hypothetical protein
VVSIIENWSQLEGRVDSVGPAADLPAFSVVQVRVSRVTAVETFANLLADAAEKTLDVYLSSEVAGRLSLSPGRRVRCRVRRGGPTRIFADPDAFEVL